MSNKRSLIHSAVPIILGMGFSFIGTAVVARVVGPETFGSYIFLLTWISMAAYLSKAGHEWVLLRFIPGRLKLGAIGDIRYLVRQAIQAVAKRALLAVFLLLLLALATGHWAQWSIIVPGALLVIVLALAELRRSWALSYRAVWLSDAPENIVKSLALAGSAILFVKWGGNVDPSTLLWVNLISTFSTALVATFLFLWIKQPDYFHIPVSHFDTSEAKGLVGAMWFATAVNITLRNLDIVAVGILTDPTTTGIYAVASRIGLLTAAPVLVLDRIVAPILAEAVENDDRANFAKTSRSYVIMTTASIVIFLIAFTFFGRSIIDMVFGHAYVSSWPIVMIMLVGSVSRSVVGPAGVAMAVGGGHRESAWITGVAALANLLLLVFLTPLYGVYGAAIAQSAAMFTKAAISAVWVFRHFNVNTTILGMWKNSE